MYHRTYRHNSSAINTQTQYRQSRHHRMKTQSIVHKAECLISAPQPPSTPASKLDASRQQQLKFSHTQAKDELNRLQLCCLCTKSVYYIGQLVNH